jgi:hypothetical protein
MKSLVPSNPSFPYRFKSLISVLILLVALNSFAQKDTLFKNTVRFNITNPIIFGWKSIIVGYERQLKNNQSFSVNIGKASYPNLSFSGLDSLQLLSNQDYSDKGFNLSFDYRFYSKDLNKYPAPRGVYIGPYYSYNYFNRTNNWALNTNAFQGIVQTDLELQIHSAGFELGYQYVFRDRLSVDLILIGPGVGYYSIKTKFDSDLNTEDELLFFEALNEFLSENIPGYDRIFDGEDFKKTGTIKTLDLGFRYMVNVGFRF